jgi:hypothetical protein
MLAIAIPSVVHAQSGKGFQTPTPEELKMTDDPKAPGAAAVYLNVEETTSDPEHFKSVYERIKVFQEKGKKLATVEVRYDHAKFHIADIAARTVHSDGTVIPLKGKPEDILSQNKGDAQYRRVVFTLPAVEVGSILEYRYQIIYGDRLCSSPQWKIQKDYFVHKAHYEFLPFGASSSGGFLTDSKGNMVNRLLGLSRLPVGVKVEADFQGRYKLDLTDIPAIPQEEWAPPMNSFRYALDFYYTDVDSASNYWASETKDWSKEVNRFAEVSDPVRDAVKGLIAPGDSELEKARRLYKAVQALDNTSFSRIREKAELKQIGLKEARHAGEIWARKSGSREEIALLYLAMLRAAGLNANAMRVVDRNKNIFNSGYLNSGQLDDTIIVLSTGGKEIYLDPGEKMCPFQTLHWKHAGASGIRQGAAAGSIPTAPMLNYADNTLLRSGDIILDEHGNATGGVNIVMTGQRALDWRQYALRNDLDEVKKSFDRMLQHQVPLGVGAHIDHFEGLDDPEVKLIAVIDLHGTSGTTTGKRLFLPGFFFETCGSQPFVNQEKRLEPVDMHYAETVIDQMVYHLPAGRIVEGAPQDIRITWAGHAVYGAKTVSTPSQIVISRQIAQGFTLANPEEYNDLRNFYLKVAANDQQQLVLTTAPAAKGN